MLEEYLDHQRKQSQAGPGRGQASATGGAPIEAQPAAPDGAGEMKEEADGPLAEQKVPHDGDDVPPL